MLNDKLLNISIGNSRKALLWQSCKLTWSEFLRSLETPKRGMESLETYLKLPKSKQDNLKDVGGFVGGMLLNGRRSKTNVVGRDLITLDFDNILNGGTDEILKKLNALSCAYAVYSTRKHSFYQPRLRIVIPTDRTVQAEEYEPIARKLAQYIGIEYADSSTFEVHRLMYYPSVCSDSDYIFVYEDKPFVSADEILKVYKDWRDVRELPQVPNAEKQISTEAKKQGNPTEKSGVVGAFCKIYDVFSAIEKFLPDVYELCDDGRRYTYRNGSSFAGAIVYADGQFLFSHHSTDPAGNKLCNAFDLVRLHKFGDQDMDTEYGTPVTKLRSYNLMCDMAVKIPEVAGIITTERYEKAVIDFTPVQTTQPENNDWQKQLARTSTGVLAKTIHNALIILENDPNLKGRVLFEEFGQTVIIKGVMPWNNDVEERQIEDADIIGIRYYFERCYDLQISKDFAADVMLLSARRKGFNAVQDYISGVPAWDGVPRLDTAYADYLSADDDEYHRAVSRKSIVALIARVFEPGIKFDTMTIFEGGQGIGKSTFLAILGGEWYTDGLSQFEGKEACEITRKFWLIEVGELQAFGKSENNTIKKFISQKKDTYLEPYGRFIKSFLRKCVFFGTTNDKHYLKDTTGERRFWPIKCKDDKDIPSKKNVFIDLEKERDQIIAEAFYRYKEGETLYLPPELEAVANKIREEKHEKDEWEGIIQDFIEKPILSNWKDMDLQARRMFWQGLYQGGEPAQRTQVCVMEIWCELFDGTKQNLERKASTRIKNILKKLGLKENYERYGFHGKQRGFWV